MSKQMTIYFVAGEVSADNHGAALMRALRDLDPNLKFIGRGGPEMLHVAGAPFKNWIGDAAVLGLWEVLRNYGYFREQFRQTLSEITENEPDAVVLIDYPGFNLRLARALRRQSQRRKTIYYISPQVWAWNRGRIKNMARFIDLVLCIFPFESDLYTTSGLRAVFVGHPMIGKLERQKIDTERDPNLIGLFPGSRSREVRKIFPVMIKAAHLLLQAGPALRFQVAAASEELADEMREMLAPHLNPLPSVREEAALQSTSGEPPDERLSSSTRKAKMQVTPNESAGGTPLPLLRGEGRVSSDAPQRRPVIEITINQTADIMQRAWAGIVASGSATLEAAYFRMPFALIYKVAWPTYIAARLVVNVDYLGMPNLLADKEVVPEFIQHQAKPDRIAKAVRLLMEDPNARDRMMSDFDAIISKLGGSGASDRAARAIFEELKDRRSPDCAGGLETAAP
jgi:lipid-A-disaccharide synthase